MKKAILIGASGLVGMNLLDKLLNSDEIGKIVLLNRKNLDISHKKLEQHEIDFNIQENFSEKITGDILFCCK